MLLILLNTLRQKCDPEGLHCLLLAVAYGRFAKNNPTETSSEPKQLNDPITFTENIKRIRNQKAGPNIRKLIESSPFYSHPRREGEILTKTFGAGNKPEEEDLNYYTCLEVRKTDMENKLSHP